jgi:HAD superfamily hydrolase (TIGR01509 family)
MTSITLHGAALQVDPAAAQARHLADAQPAVGAKQDERPVVRPDRVSELQYLRGGEEPHLLPLDLRQRHPSARRCGIMPVSTAAAAPVEAILREAELAATKSATPTPHARDVILACHQTSRRLAVISNSQAAVETYLRTHHLAEHVDVIVGRTQPDARLLKPHPHLVLRALDALDGDPATSAFVGDSTSDIQSAKAAGTRSIGYANKPGKLQRLQHAGADAVVTSMAELHKALLTDQPSS